MGFFPRAVKSVQYGTISLASVASNTGAISAVNLNYSIVECLGVDGNDGPSQVLARVRLTSSTQVTAYAGGLTSTLVVAFKVTEYYQFFFRQPVQEGVISFTASGSATGTASVTAALGTGELVRLGSNAVTPIVNSNATASITPRLSVSGTTVTATRSSTSTASRASAASTATGHSASAWMQTACTRCAS